MDNPSNLRETKSLTSTIWHGYLSQRPLWIIAIQPLLPSLLHEQSECNRSLSGGVLPLDMRSLVAPALVMLAACGGGSGSGDPAASVASIDCKRLGPDGTGFMFDVEYRVALQPGQAFLAEFQFPTSAAPVHRSDIYNCGSWSNTGTSGLDKGCQRNPGQADVSQRVFHSLAIEFPAPLPPPVTVTVIAKPLTAPGSSTTIGDTDLDTVTCP